MLKKHGTRGLVIGVVGLAAPLWTAQAQDVELNPGTITGTVRVGTETIRSLFVNASSSPFSASQSLFVNAPSATYDLTVQVEAGSSRTYSVSAGISGLGGDTRDSLNFGSGRAVTVTDGTPATLDFIVDDPGFIDGTVTLTGGGLISSLSLSARQTTSPFASSSTSAFVSGGSTTIDYGFPVVPGQPMRCSGSMTLTNGVRINLPQQIVTPPAGGTARCDYTVATPQTGSIAGTVNLSGPQSVDRYELSVSGPQFTSTTVLPPFDGPGNSDSYRIDNLQAGTYGFSSRNARLNSFDDRFTFPDPAFDPAAFGLTVTAGGETTVDISACQAFLTGNLELTGTASLDDLSSGEARARGNPTAGSLSRSGSSSDRITQGTGAFDLVVSEGEWAPDSFSLGLSRPLGDPDGFLNQSIFLSDQVSRVNFIDFACGETAVRDFSFPTGSITINFTVAGGGVLSNPRLSGSCQERDDTTNELLYNYSFSSVSSGQIDVPLGQVTFEGPAAVCSSITARATVAGSLTTFATINNLEIVPGVDIVIDPGAPTVMVTFPEADLIIDADEITVEGIATDTVDIASLTVNGVPATRTSTNNPNDPIEETFEATVPLPDKGPNDIVVVATDSAGNESITTLNVFNDAGVPELSFTPADGERTPLDFSVAGTASDDAGIASVVISIDGSQVAVLDGGDALSFPFSVPVSLGAGDHTITVVVTDISERSTTVVRMITAADNAPPVANDLNIQTDEDMPVAVMLDASDPDGDPLTFQVLSSPSNGTLSGTAPDLIYTPDPNFFGLDSFRYLANDGALDSNEATVAIAVQPVNDAPVAVAAAPSPLECTGPEGAPVVLDGSGSSDVENDPLSFTWSNSFGTASGVMPTVTLPLGNHTVSLVVNDGALGSAAATVGITVQDTTAPIVSASLTPSGDGDDDDDGDEGRFTIGISASDTCDPAAAVTAVLLPQGCSDITVADGQLIEFEFDDEECEAETEDGVIEIEAPGLTLKVTVADASGNTAVAEAQPTGLSSDNDDDTDGSDDDD